MTRTRSARLLALAWTCLSWGCAPTAMKVPAAAQASPAWPLSGYSEGSFREPDIMLAGRTVRVVQRVSLQSGAGHRNLEDVAARRYRFTLSSPGLALAGECNEVTEPRKLWLLRYGAGEVHLDCSCLEGTRLRSQLALIDGKGTLRLASGASFQVAPIHETSDGKHDKDTLGYAISSERGSGAIERTGHGRAWPVAGLSEQENAELACGYAALLLFRQKP